MKQLHALLIGIDHYLRSPYCSSLEGAVADVEAMKVYLTACGVPPDRIQMLTASDSGDEQPPEAESRLPTYENMVAAMRDLTARAEPGDQVLIHFSGHGGKVTSLIPGEKEIDEGLVPFNIADPQARYLRDVELTYLIRTMIDKELVITLIVDACHSASIVRGHGRANLRGTRTVDKTQRPETSCVAPIERLESNWKRLYSRSYRGASRWLPDLEGLVLIAACRSWESAFELPFDGKMRGILTYCLIQLLVEGRADLSCQQIYHRLSARVRRHLMAQTPVIEGMAGRSLLSGVRRPVLGTVRVIDIDAEDRRVKLDIGRALGIGLGALFRILPASNSDRRDNRDSSILVEVTDNGAVESWALAQGDDLPRIKSEDLAILVDPGESFRRRVALTEPPEDPEDASSGARACRSQPCPTRNRRHEKALPREVLTDLHHALEARRSGFLEIAAGGGGTDGRAPDFEVTLDRQGRYEIRDRLGQPFADLPAAPSVPGAARQLVDHLVHLARFHNVRDLENRDQDSHLHQTLQLEIGLLPQGWKPGDTIRPLPFEIQGAPPSVKTGRWICLTVDNRSTQPLDIFVLDLQPGWSIELIHPLLEHETLEGGQRVHLPFEVYLPRDFQDQHEIFKVIACADPANFYQLELPPIDRLPSPPRSVLRAPQNPLERFFAEIAVDGPRTRTMRGQRVSQHWTSAEIEFEVVVGD